VTQAQDELVKKLEAAGIQELPILAAFRKIPRDLFVDEEWAHLAYADQALPIACGQTISQPYVVARMTQLLLADGPCKKILEIGTGSGYQAAILSQLVSEVYTVERIKTLYQQACQRFISLRLKHIFAHYGDGYEGWALHAPYDGIIVTAAAPEVPSALLRQLADGGRLVMPVGDRTSQVLLVTTRSGNEYKARMEEPVVFVPLLPKTAP
jgi:protein-L-isoaspartate(D-aspartate) O-methyltransferase